MATGAAARNGRVWQGPANPCGSPHTSPEVASVRSLAYPTRPEEVTVFRTIRTTAVVIAVTALAVVPGTEARVTAVSTESDAASPVSVWQISASRCHHGLAVDPETQRFVVGATTYGAVCIEG